MPEDGGGLGVFVAEEEFNGSELVRLEARGVAEDSAELNIFGWSEGFEYGPLFEEHSLDMFNSSENFEAGAEFVGLDMSDGGAELVDNELHPEF